MLMNLCRPPVRMTMIVVAAAVFSGVGPASAQDGEITYDQIVAVAGDNVQVGGVTLYQLGFNYFVELPPEA